MPKARRQRRCTDAKLTRLLEEFKATTLDQPGREFDLKRFLDHIEVCQPCRSATLDHANEQVLFPQLEAIARRRGVPADEVLNEFIAEGERLRQIAKERGVPFEVVLKETLSRHTTGN